MKEKLQNLKPKQVTTLYYVVLFFSVWLLYGNTLQHEYNLDDSYYINLLPDKTDGFKANFNVFSKWFGKSNYRPIPAFHLSIEQFVFGRSPGVFHFFNLIYYSLLGIVLFALFKKLKLFDKQWPIFLMVLFFIIHPSHSNVVASIKNRDVILSMLYGMMFVYTIVVFQEQRKWYLIPLSIILILASAGCKIDGVLFVALAGILLYYLKEVRLKKLLMPLLGVMGVAVALYALSTMVLLNEPEVKATTDFWENPMINVQFKYGLILNTGIAAIYHKFMLIPTDYFFYFGFEQIKIPSLFSAQIIVAFIAHLIIAIAAIYHLIKGKRNKIMMGVIIYFLFLLPFVALMHTVAGIVAVRYTFNASLGFSILVIAIYYLIYQKSNNTIKPIIAILLAGIFMVFSYYTFQRNKDWKNKETLFTTDLKKANRSYMANRMAGIYFFNIAKSISDNTTKAKYINYAEKYLNTAKEIIHHDPVMWVKLGELNVSKQNYKEAYFNFKKAIEEDSTSLYSWQAYGEFCILANDFERTENAYRQILELDDDNTNAYRQLLNALVKQRKVEEAISIADAMTQHERIRIEGYEYLGNIYWEIGDTLKSVENFRYSIESGNTNQNIIEFVDNFDKSNSN